MREAKHTPGPWTVDLHHTRESAGRTYGFIHANTAVPLAAITLGVEGMPQDEGRANARLIGAVPDMLAALEAILSVRPSNWDDDEDMEQWAAWVKVETVLDHIRGQL